MSTMQYRIRKLEGALNLKKSTNNGENCSQFLKLQKLYTSWLVLTVISLKKYLTCKAAQPHITLLLQLGNLDSAYFIHKRQLDDLNIGAAKGISYTLLITNPKN